MARRVAAKSEPTTSLPQGVIASDLQYPKYNEKNPERVTDTLTFIDTGNFAGWVLQTLWINQRQNRTYAVGIDGKSCRVGNPNSRLVTVYVTEKRAARLKKWLDLKGAGSDRAGEIRDRIGSRRAEGVIRRARGERSWLWDK